jgi:hypothetical protein
MLTACIPQSGLSIVSESWQWPQNFQSNVIGGFMVGSQPQNFPETLTSWQYNICSTQNYCDLTPFYWLVGAEGNQILSFQYDASNGQAGFASVTFNILGPSGNLLLQPNMKTDGSGVQVLLDGSSPKLSTTGIPVGTKQVGITFTSSASLPSGVNQSFTWVQVLTSVQRQYVTTAGPYATPTGTGLDLAFPYANASPTTTNDKPAAFLPSIYGEGWESFSATMYLMWDPGLPTGCHPASTDPNTLQSTPSDCTSIPIPLSSVNYHWSGCAINTLVSQSNGTTWTLSTVNGCPVDTLGTPQISDTASGFPVWTNVYAP